MKKFLSKICLAVLLGGMVLPAPARFARADTEQVPVARLAANLEKQIADKPEDASLHARLARLYSMAYALKTDQIAMDKRSQEPFFGYTDRDHPPRQITKAIADEAAAVAKKHLQLAVAGYEKALALDPKHLAARLGLGWCHDQAGNKAAALPYYRQALAQAWEKESKGGRGLDTPWTSEAANYLLPLLDPQKDADEIARIKTYQAEIAKQPRMVTPILIPLEANTPFTDLVNADAAVTFDLDGSGLPRQWGWITPKAAWLVFDLSDQGHITSGLQLFGAVSFWLFWNNGYEALGALDNDGDGLLRGDELQHIKLWHDANGNGVSDPGEVKSLASHGITALSVRNQTHSTGIPFSPAGVVLKDGTTRPSYDWIAPSRAGLSLKGIGAEKEKLRGNK